MFDFFKTMFKEKASVDFPQLKKRGAQIIDVRTPGEYSAGHIKGSINIPLNTLAAHLPKISHSKPVITCCASGMRSASARQILMNKGFEEVYNGGPWRVLEHKLEA